MASRAVEASLRTRVSSKRPQGAQARPRSREDGDGRSTCSGRARRAGSRSSGTSAASARARRRPAAGGRRRRAWRRRRRLRSSAAASRRCRASRRRGRRGRSRVRRPRRAPRRRSSARGVAVVERGEEVVGVAHVPAVGRERGEQDVAGLGRARLAAAPVVKPVAEAASAGAWPSVRCPPRTGTPSLSAAQRRPSSTRFGVVLARARRACRRCRAAGRPSPGRRRRW